MDIPFEILLKNEEKIISETKRYLGYSNKEPDKEINQFILSAIEEISKNSLPKYLIRTFRSHIDEDNHLISFEKMNCIINSKDLSQFLNGSQEIVILAATLGLQLDQLVKQKSYLNLTKTLVIDATASAIIEEVCDFAENKFRSELKLEKSILTQRYSPGYGDLSIELQPAILKVLNASKLLGIYTTDRFQLIPSKSVTAFMGIKSIEDSSEVIPSETRVISETCQKCYHHYQCFYLKKGEICELQRKIIAQR